ncbi:metalloprotease [Gordonia paraffinivorans]|uniref:metalloprotease n=1 Tax=Gordonia paraffinivorans TaxID=175628 RepID=UPI00242D7E2B|nr:metalloprotease [Gordonia paraffinivorans]
MARGSGPRADRRDVVAAPRRRGAGTLRWLLSAGVVAVLAATSACSLIPADDQAPPAESSRVPTASSTSTSPGSASRSRIPTSTPSSSEADPTRCRPGDCPKLATPATSLMRSGVDGSNARTAVPRYLTTLLDDLDETWGGWFTELGWGDPAPGRVLVRSGTAYRTDCTDEDGVSPRIRSDEANAFFCSVDRAPDGDGRTTVGSVVLPVDTFAAIWDGDVFGVPSPIVGDFTAAIVVAHEYGHNVVHRMAERFGIPAVRLPQGKNSELLADCLASNWASTAYKRDALGPKEILQVATLLPIIGDTGGATGHGSAVERAKALTIGLTGPQFNRQGQPSDCLTKYWPQFYSVR